MKSIGKIFEELSSVSGIIIPDISFYTSDASTRFKNSTAGDALRVNKIIKYLKMRIVLSKYDNLIRTL